MMRIVSLLLLFCSLPFVSAAQEQKIPATLSEAHAELERIFSAEELTKIDAMPSDGGMAQYHHGLGTSMRNAWGLWRNSALAQHMRELGFTHPDDMSGVILGTFWCKRHGRDFRLEERAAQYKRSWADRNNPRQGSRGEIRKMMMELRFEKRDVPVVPIAVPRSGANVRFMCPFRDGVFLTAYCQGSVPSHLYEISGGLNSDDGRARVKPEYDDGVARGSYHNPRAGRLHQMKPGEDFYTVGCYFDPTDGAVHRIRVPEINDVYAAVVADDRAWFAGLTGEKAVLVGVGDRDRITVPLPEADEIPDLGMDGQSLLAVYCKTIYRLSDRRWTLVHSGDILLPRSGLPPQRHGDMVFLRDEGVNETRKRLWWLTMGEKPRLRLLVRDMGLFGLDSPQLPGWQDISTVAPPRWGETSSYYVTSTGDLWACVGYGAFVLRRSQDGVYSYAIADRSVRFAEDPPASEETEPDLSISGVTALPDDTLLLVGYTGLYRLAGNEIVQELAFAPQDDSGKTVGRGNWNPNNVIILADGSYFISTGFWRGVYWLRPGNDAQWTCLRAGEGDPVVW